MASSTDTETATPVEKADRRMKGQRAGKKHRFRFERPREISNLRWNYINPGADETELLCDTTLPEGTSLTFKVMQLEGRVQEPLPSSYTYDAKPEGEQIGSEVKGTVEADTAKVTWPFPADDDGTVISPYDPVRWYRNRDDLDFTDEDELPENLDEMLMEDDLQPFVFIVEYQDEWAMSPSPASGEIDISLDMRGEGEAGSAAWILTADGEMDAISAVEGAIKKGEVADGPVLLHVPNVYFAAPDEKTADESS